jgi:formylglycine-generating enzyme required for sulfatase activity
MSDANLGNSLTTELGTKFTSGGRYTLTSVNITAKRDELRATYASGGGSSIDRTALAEWGRKNSISAICLVVDDVKGIDNLFSAQLIDTKDSKLDGKGSYVRTSVAAGDVTRVALALSRQLEGPRRVARAAVTSQRLWFEPEMVFVEGGTFTMGCNGTTDVQPSDNKCYAGDKRETPPHRVKVSSFSIGKYEITRAQWIAVMKGHVGFTDQGSWKDDDQVAVDQVSWYLIDTAFLPRLRAMTGKNYRLPTEAEWEYAARGCKAGICDAYKYSGSNTAGEVAWYSATRIYSVGQKKPNGLGIYDMSGNVWEWCSDWFDVNYYSTLTDGVADPKGPDKGSIRTRRGGGYANDAITWSRVAGRNGIEPQNVLWNVGFRVALPAQ